MASTDEIAELLHDVWCARMRREGYVLGPSRDDSERTHPHLKPWNEKTESERDQDRAQAERVASLLLVTEEAPTVDAIADAIHEAFKGFRRAAGGDVPADRENWRDNPRLREERTEQATEILRRFKPSGG